MLDLLFSMDDIHVYLSRPERIHIDKNTEICFDHKDMVVGLQGFEQWWTEEYHAIKLYNYKSEDFHENLLKCRDRFIVIDNGDLLLNDEDRRFINFESSNQYMLFLRNCDGLNLSADSFMLLREEGYMVTLERELAAV